jgi:hypothetical protein
LAGRPKTVSDDAKATTVSFTPTEKMVIHVIIENRKARKEKGITANEIVVDAVWHLLECVEHKTRAQIEALLPPAPQEQAEPRPKVTEMPSNREKKKR